MRPRFSKIHSIPGTLMSSSVSSGRFSKKSLILSTGIFRTPISSPISFPCLPTNSTSGARKCIALVAVRTGDTGTEMIGMSLSAL